MANVLVQHHGLGLFHIGLAAQNSGEPRTIHLMPGVNLVDDKEWEEAGKSKVVQYHLKHPKRAPMFEVISGGHEGGKSPLAKMSVEEAKEVVAATFHEELLKEWEKLETRMSVQRAISKQIVAIDVPGAAKKDEE